MEFDLATWHRQPASRWLVKLVDDHVHAGTIHACNDAGVVVHAGIGNRLFTSHEIDWIRPLIEVSADGWTVVTGFQAEDSTFDTWWIHDDVLLRINFSAPSGFSDLVHVIAPHDLSTIPAPSLTPSLAVRSQVQAQIHRILIDRKTQGVPPLAHLQ